MAQDKLLRVPGSDKFRSTGIRPSRDKIHPRLRIFEGDASLKVDPVTFEVLAHKFWQVNDEQGQALQKISGSPVATDANDFNVVLCDAYGDIVNIGPYYLPHAANVDFMVKWILENRSANPGIHPGDMFICNDPWVGALHPMDVAVLSPIFVGEELLCWTGSTIHQVDIGGVNVGSWCVDTDDHFAEGMTFPPTKIVDGGMLRADIEELYLRGSRSPGLLGLDLRAHIASNNVARERVLALVDRYGIDVVHRTMAGVMDYAEGRFRERLLEIPDGEWRHETYQEVAKKGDRGVYRTVLTVRKSGDHLTLDFTGTDPNVGMISSTRAGAVGGSMVGILPLLCFDIPWALGGIHRALDFITPHGTLVDVEFPHAVSMGSISTTWACTNASNIALAKMMSAAPTLADRVLAGCVGSWTTVIASGEDTMGEPFVTMIMDTMAGGWGARSFGDGVDTGGLMAAITGQCPNVETNEARYPILYLYRREDTDSGGAGEFRGGMGGTSCWVPFGPRGEHELDLVLATFGQAFPTAVGINGGYPANTSMYKMVRDSDVFEHFRAGRVPTDLAEVGGQLEFLAPKESTHQGPFDVFEHSWSGGGGFGDPLDRDPELVGRDVLVGAVSGEAAFSIYGVVLNEAGVDSEGTQRRRSEIRALRVGHAVTPQPKPETDGWSPLDRHLAVDSTDQIVCTQCGHGFGSVSENYKDHARRGEITLPEANPRVIEPSRFVDPPMVFRQYFCPGCGTCLENDVARAEDSTVKDKTLSSRREI